MRCSSVRRLLAWNAADGGRARVWSPVGGPATKLVPPLLGGRTALRRGARARERRRHRRERRGTWRATRDLVMLARGSTHGPLGRLAGKKAS